MRNTKFGLVAATEESAFRVSRLVFRLFDV
jgi:hypothetical protein